MTLLMIGHLIGDFYFQTDEMAEDKKISFKKTAKHCLYYSFAIYLILTMATSMPFKYILPTIIIGILHLIVDGIKVLIYKKDKNEKYESAKNKIKVFAIDQIIHILILWFVGQWIVIEPDISWIPQFLEKISSVLIGNQIIVLVCLFCGKPSAVIVSLVFGLIPKTIRNAEKQNCIVNENQDEDNKLIESNNAERAKIGSWIGILEREIILILGLFGEYEAIGFVIAAKSLARHSQFDNSAFAEKYLVGTLLSTIIAILGILLCSIC